MILSSPDPSFRFERCTKDQVGMRTLHQIQSNEQLGDEPAGAKAQNGRPPAVSIGNESFVTLDYPSQLRSYCPHEFSAHAHVRVVRRNRRGDAGFFGRWLCPSLIACSMLLQLPELG